MYKNRLVIVVSGILLLSLLALLGWFFDKPINNSTPKPPIAQVVQPPSVTSSPIAKPPVIATPTSLPPLAKSLQGTQVDGDIIIDGQKQLVVTEGLRRLFDYFLSAQGEESLQIISQRIREYIQSHTPEPAASQALVIYQQYLKYLQGIAAIEKKLSVSQLNTHTQDKLDILLIQQRQQAVKDLRQQFFDAKTRLAFFGQEDALDDYNLQVLTATQNPNLSMAARNEALKVARQSYIQSFTDSDTRQKMLEHDKLMALLNETEQLKKQGASEAELTAMRRKYVSEDAVQRLAAIDQSEAAFAQRAQHFAQQRAQILMQQGVTAAAQQAINDLQNQQFSDREQLRLDAFLKK